MAKKKTRLIEYLRNRCEYRRKMLGSSEFYYCIKKYEQKCHNSDTFFVEYPDCPDTCPHHVKNVNIECNCNTKCKKIEEEKNNLLKVIEDEER